MSWVDYNCVYRITSANRGGPLPAPGQSAPTTAPKNPNFCLAFAGSAGSASAPRGGGTSGTPSSGTSSTPSATTSTPASTGTGAPAATGGTSTSASTSVSTSGSIVMQPLPAAMTGPVPASSGQLWMFRQADGNDASVFTIHNLATGESVCLDRSGTNDVLLKPLVKGQVSQQWYADTVTAGRISASGILAAPRPQIDPEEGFRAPGGSDTNLDVKVGGDVVVVKKVVRGGGPPGKNDLAVEGTKWNVVLVRPIAWSTTGTVAVPG